MSTQKTGISTIAGNGDSPLAQGEFEWHCVSEMGVEFKPGTPIDYWLNAVKQALDMYEGSVKLRTRIKFILGDMLAFGESAFGESYAQAIDQTRRALDLSEKSLSNLQWIAPRIPIAARHDDLSFAHYEAVAALPDDGKKAEYLHRALAENLTARALKKEVKAEFPP